MRDLKTCLKQCEAILDQLNIPYSDPLEIKVNTRAKNRWGQCVRERYGYFININALLLQEEVDIRALQTTILHELLHTNPGCQNHGPKWQSYAKAVNEATGLNLQTTNMLHEEYGFASLFQAGREKEPDRYLVTCTKCGYERRYKRASKVVNHPERYRCGLCRGVLTSTILEAA